ncbi:uncharacterized protein METZ01_LOCUS484958 [marine metagenome]|uniref:Lipoprotein n=1 Tax=marine metagenome TaxID=408172 RepID=A0A383CIY4_9ZZZZ
MKYVLTVLAVGLCLPVLTGCQCLKLCLQAWPEAPQPKPAPLKENGPVEPKAAQPKPAPQP